jgi:uncharacterized phage protein (TIGR02220 family)
VVRFPKKSTPARRQPGTIPPELQPIVERVIGKINELSGSSFRPDSKLVLKGLVPRLKSGATEKHCLAVVESKWQEWGDTDFRRHFNPETLFRETHFEKYLNAARQDSALSRDRDPEWRKRTFSNV